MLADIKIIRRESSFFDGKVKLYNLEKQNSAKVKQRTTKYGISFHL